MRTIRRYIEQLEEAACQLDKEKSTAARIALFLTDNLTELLMYEQVSYIFACDSLFGKWIPPKYSPNKRKKVIYNFNEKVNFIMSETRDIQLHEGNVLKVGHQIRNETYHTSLLREAIILSVARVYFQTLCELLPQLWLGSITISSEDKEESITFLRKYGIEGPYFFSKEALKSICSQVLGGRQCTTSNLSKVLATDLANRIEMITEELEYLSSNAFRLTGPDEVLKVLQFSQKLATEHDFPSTEDGARDYFRTYEQLLHNYSPPVTIDRMNRWKQQAFSLKTEQIAGAVLQKYSDLDRKVLPVQTLVDEAVAELDKQIELEVDRQIESKHTHN